MYDYSHVTYIPYSNKRTKKGRKNFHFPENVGLPRNSRSSETGIFYFWKRKEGLEEFQRTLQFRVWKISMWLHEEVYMYGLSK